MTLEAATALLGDVRARVGRSYGDAIGRQVEELVTPALVLDADGARRNIEARAKRMETMPASIRPHIKVHKSPELSRLQVEAGAIGLSMATVWEAIALVRWTTSTARWCPSSSGR